MEPIMPQPERPDPAPTTRAVLTLLLLLAALAAPVAANAAPKKKPAEPPPVVAPAPVALPVAVTPEAPLAPGALVLVVDADTDDATVGGQAASLKKGENRLGLPAGNVAYVIQFASGLTVKGDAIVPAGGDVRAEAWSTGGVLLHVGEGAKVEIDGKSVPVVAGQAAADVGIGSHTVVVTQPGYVGRKASVDVTGGHISEITANLDKFEVPVDNTVAWVGILGGGALVVTALIIDAATDYNKVGGEATRWSLLGIGTAGFVGGTLLLKHNMDAVGLPPTKDGTFEVKISRWGTGAMALLGWRF
jgi:hypothetical protein